MDESLEPVQAGACRKRPEAFFDKRDTACRVHPLGTLAGRDVSFSRHMSPKMTNSNFILPPSGGKTLRGFPAGKFFDRLSLEPVQADFQHCGEKSPRAQLICDIKQALRACLSSPDAPDGPGFFCPARKKAQEYWMYFEHV